MKDNTWRFLKGLFLMAIAVWGVFSAQLLLEFARSGHWLSPLSSLSPNEAQAFMNVLNGKLNQALAVILVVVALAVPLTANMYSVKVLDFFIRNPVNGAVLIFIVLANLSGLWATYIMKNRVIPFQLNLVTILTVVSLLLILPYLFYVFRFLHPNTLLRLLEGEIAALLKAAFHPAGAGKHRQRVAESLEHIANISIRSVDRSDRNTAIEGTLTLERVARDYWAVKEKLHPSWFEANPNFFLGFSSLAMGEMTRSRSWVEMKLYYQFFEIMRAACPRMPELTSTVAKSLRKLGLEAAALNDPALRELVIEYFNTFIRLAINRRDVRSLFLIFAEYRNFGEALNKKFPEETLEIAYYFTYYSQVAREQQMLFVVEVVAHDLGTLVEKAWENEAANRQELLERFLQFDPQATPALPGVKKAQALLASYFLLAGRIEPAAMIRENFQGLEPAFIQSLKKDLLQITRQKFWEVSERRMNIDFVSPAQREKLREFFDSLLKDRGNGGNDSLKT
ncbi:MAG: hypothetical protein NTY64_03005 [Deltaproteobacteria bacterium]|nr:hypothetical protein [Deltaproteobacteria bacterium]